MHGQTMNNDVTLAGGENPLFAGRYHVVRQLGTGGMGAVWLAEDRQLDNKPFAVKMLPSILVANKRAYRQLKDEAILAMKLVHPNIVQIRAFEENSGNPFLVMDYIEGQTLDDYLAEKGKLSEDETVRLLKPIASALDYAHGEGVVHRDVKPANIMIRKDGHPYILDFGIAHEIQETMTRVTGKLSSGTLLYMSPEQLRGQPPKAAQDVYSFAAMAYECLKGEPPFSRGQIEYQILNEQPERLSNDIRMSASIMRGLSKTPVARPDSCVKVLLTTSPTRQMPSARPQVAVPPRPAEQMTGKIVVRPKSNIVGIVLPLFCLVAALLVLGGVLWHREAQLEENARRLAEEQKREELRRRQTEDEIKSGKAAIAPQEKVVTDKAVCENTKGDLFKQMSDLMQKVPQIEYLTNDLSAVISIDAGNLVVNNPVMIIAKVELPKAVSNSVGINNASLWLVPTNNVWEGSFVSAVTNDMRDATSRVIEFNFNVRFMKPYKGTLNFSADVTRCKYDGKYKFANTQRVSALPVKIEVKNGDNTESGDVVIAAREKTEADKAKAKALQDAKDALAVLLKDPLQYERVSMKLTKDQRDLLSPLYDEVVRGEAYLKELLEKYTELNPKVVGTRKEQNFRVSNFKTVVKTLQNGNQPSAPVASPTERFDDYVVKAGDSFDRIAISRGSSITALKELNGFDDSQLQLRVGQVLKVPRKVAQDEAEHMVKEATKSFVSAFDNKNYDQAASLRFQADQNDPEVQLRLGWMYAFGHGVAKNGEEAVKIFHRLEQHDPLEAWYALGVLYFMGCGVAKDDSKAFEYCKKAAERGYCPAQWNLAVMYNNGKGVVKDEKEAVKWWRKAAEQGNLDAQRELRARNLEW